MDGSGASMEPWLAGNAPPPQRMGWTLKRPDGRQNALPGIIAAAYEQPVVRQTSPMGPYYVVSHPDGVRRVLVDNVANYPKTPMEQRFFAAVFGNGLISSDGETWRTHRRTMAPSFSPPSVAAYAPGIAEEAMAFRDRWDAAPAGEAINVARDMSRLTLAIISRAMFSTDGVALTGVVERAITGALAGMKIGLADFIPGIGGIVMAVRRRRMARVFAELDAVTARLIAERETSPRGEDLLARLIEARDAEDGSRMTAGEVRDQVVTIFLVGHETSAVALAWTWYLLSQHPDVEARLHGELDAVLGGRAPTYEDLPRLAYTRMVIEEAMRLYPPAPGTSTRVALKTDEVCGTAIPAGSPIVVAPWITHRHRAIWDRPERFDPGRFAKDAPERPRFSYLPFGAGPRVCIGASLAMTELVIILATLAQRYRLRLPAGHVVELQHQITLRPKGGLPMIVERR